MADEIKYTQLQWDREIGWGEVPKEYAHETKLEEYKRKINYDAWEDVAHVQGITFNRQPYNIKEVNLNYSMKANEYVQPRTDKPTRSNNRNDKS